ncbi:phosphonate ABC transporter ATP-binding protein [Brooklawnia cerclae]|uniref:Phosphonate transport system ATP-binding protein n=1 Tax=Brooklawnia cerclae TaxID=349934 RepID=A0ABX0SHW1_9ACTN|nr:phosphonate ABC transporter ATP-binding protein [Brooklawnia cerclae]NIH57993.1 phosphonate transport system ATP-binding protein [Brooklawnia cerclae]
MTQQISELPTPDDFPVVFNQVTKQFSETVFGLDHVDARFERGRTTVLLGLSGSGKSTMLRHINGLHRPTSGTVRVLGTDVGSASERELRDLRKQIGFIFQHFHLVGPMSVLENVCSGRLGSLRGPRFSLLTYPRAVKSTAMEQLERVGLADRAFQRADTLSGGQQQRVAIARALIQQPKILLADEPVASLDPVSSAQVLELITRIAREEHLTVICSLHQVQTAVEVADHIIGLQSGRKVLDRPGDNMTSEDALHVYDRVAAVSDDEEPAATGTASQTTPTVANA